jgi:hypothetical protein
MGTRTVTAATGIVMAVHSVLIVCVPCLVGSLRSHMLTSFRRDHRGGPEQECEYQCPGGLRACHRGCAAICWSHDRRGTHLVYDLSLSLSLSHSLSFAHFLSRSISFTLVLSLALTFCSLLFHATIPLGSTRTGSSRIPSAPLSSPCSCCSPQRALPGRPHTSSWKVR